MGVLVVDGRQTPAEDCVWVEFAACGCPCGAVTTVCGGLLVHTPETARAALHPDRWGHKESLASGTTFRLMLLETFRALTFDCEHDPKWGAPQPIMTTNKLPASRRDNLDYDVDPTGDTVTVHVYAPIGDDGAVELNESDVRALLAAIEKADQ